MRLVIYTSRSRPTKTPSFHARSLGMSPTLDGPRAERPVPVNVGMSENSASIGKMYYDLGGTYDFELKTVIGKILTSASMRNTALRSETPPDRLA